ncbi:PREDICTED: U-box domain-containing protein 63 isoform X2 [Tarenaya hassleriana]|uniref:U-box domain-containing protein 63 isoform X2 n=1 Tax=Tarenaya hassleriana TaxID=28532 RepID=UPI00053C5AE6|nr:PREDICTED: U-box domain-containing protein 63 isoform X2 [Tarenaya hassleriana]
MSVNDGIDSRLIFHEEDDPLRFRVGEPGPKSRELASFFGGDRRFELRRSFCDVRTDHVETRGSDGDDMVNDDAEVRKRAALIEPGDNCSSAADAGTDKHGSLGRELVLRVDEAGKSSFDLGEVNNKVTIADPHGNVYQSQYNTQATREFAFVQKDKASTNVGSCESLRTILSDPVTGALMDDAMILPCGHSFGGGGIEKVKRTKACCTCSQPVSEESIKPNLSLRVVVHAFRQEEEVDHSHFPKRRKERSDQDKRIFCLPSMVETPKSRGIQFPYSIGDRVIIKVCSKDIGQCRVYQAATLLTSQGLR